MSMKRNARADADSRRGARSRRRRHVMVLYHQASAAKALGIVDRRGFDFHNEVGIDVGPWTYVGVPLAACHDEADPRGAPGTAPPFDSVLFELRVPIERVRPYEIPGLPGRRRLFLPPAGVLSQYRPRLLMTAHEKARLNYAYFVRFLKKVYRSPALLKRYWRRPRASAGIVRVNDY